MSENQNLTHKHLHNDPMALLPACTHAATSNSTEAFVLNTAWSMATMSLPDLIKTHNTLCTYFAVRAHSTSKCPLPQTPQFRVKAMAKYKLQSAYGSQLLIRPCWHSLVWIKLVYLSCNILQCLVLKIAIWVANLVLWNNNNKMNYGLGLDRLSNNFWRDPKHTNGIYHFIVTSPDILTPIHSRRNGLE